MSAKAKTREDSPEWGFAVASIFLFLAVIAIWAVSYLRLRRATRDVVLVVGGLLALIAVAGAATEVSKLNRPGDKKADLWWLGAGVACAIPAVALGRPAGGGPAGGCPGGA
jgi:cell division protein FtsW (lipid II flippase)